MIGEIPQAAHALDCLGCGRLIPRGSRCSRCAEAARPSFRARRGIGGWQWAGLRAAVRARDGGCVRCGPRAGLEVHHVVPLADGGSNSADNLVTLCRECHRDEPRR